MSQEYFNQFFTTDDGSISIISGRFGERYHSRFGALGECQHISISNGFHAIPAHLNNVEVLEVGFGTGLNAWLTFIESAKAPDRNVKYTGLEGYPLTAEEISKLNYSEYFPRFASDFDRIQSIAWNSETRLSSNFVITKVHALFEDFEYPDSQYNLVYYDPFAPGCQPAMWVETMLDKVYRSMTVGGILVTYCAQGAFRRALKSWGFMVEKLPGPPGKREMTRAVKTG